MKPAPDHKGPADFAKDTEFPRATRSFNKLLNKSYSYIVPPKGSF